LKCVIFHILPKRDYCLTVECLNRKIATVFVNKQATYHIADDKER